ncbi:transposase [Lacticaseibacillus paracasei subsp. paracasei Lpp123]|uniref:Transposase n=1 Tax=Lacticaseibacillus paracasei subsp. paracasei Lpp123 TaxID=1256201 RepID=A0A829GCS4_LACPA|nr:transposase [Lacticaseibacillus paracasei subsp. paracasei Lpp123]
MQTMIEKYRKKVPACRQGQGWPDVGLPLNRQQITNRHIVACVYGLANLYELIHQELLKQTIVHTDETNYRGLEREKVNAYFWIFASGYIEDKQIILYEHANFRATAVPEHFLTGYTHYL